MCSYMQFQRNTNNKGASIFYFEEWKCILMLNLFVYIDVYSKIFICMIDILSRVSIFSFHLKIYLLMGRKYLIYIFIYYKAILVSVFTTKNDFD